MFEVLQPLSPDLFWVLCLAFVIAFLLAFSVGANDVSNSFGTSVGSRVLTVTQACILATFFEVAGATLLGYAVCDFFRRDMYDLSLYEDSQRELMVGALACLIGSSTWNIVATFFKMPISGTHSIVGATLGFSIVLRGWDSIRWMRILRIVASWFASPLLSGCISSIIYLLISKTVIRKIDPLRHGLKTLPLFYGMTVFINVASVVINGPNVLGLNRLVWYEGLFISLVAGAIAITCVAVFMVPKMRKRILDEMLVKTKSPADKSSKIPMTPQRMTTTLSILPNPDQTAFDNVAFRPDKLDDSKQEKKQQTVGELRSLDASQLADQSKTGGDKSRPAVAPKPSHLLKRQQAQDQQQLEEIDLEAPEKPRREGHEKRQKDDIEAMKDKLSGRPEMIRGERFEVFRLFSSLQILTACFASFAHGTNDVSNAVAPLIPIWNIYANGYEDIHKQTQIWILAFGGIGICTGLWAWGRAVMGTVGDGLTQLTPSKGFSIELGAAISVLMASKLGLPISTTHCKVGSVVIVGLISSHFCSQDNLLDMTNEQKELESEKKAVDWKLFGNIAITWIVTVPAAALASASVTMLLKWLVL